MVLLLWVRCATLDGDRLGQPGPPGRARLQIHSHRSENTLSANRSGLNHFQLHRKPSAGYAVFTTAESEFVSPVRPVDVPGGKVSRAENPRARSFRVVEAAVLWPRTVGESPGRLQANNVRLRSWRPLSGRCRGDCSGENGRCEYCERECLHCDLPLLVRTVSVPAPGPDCARFPHQVHFICPMVRVAWRQNLPDQSGSEAGQASRPKLKGPMNRSKFAFAATLTVAAPCSPQAAVVAMTHHPMSRHRPKRPTSSRVTPSAQQTRPSSKRSSRTFPMMLRRPSLRLPSATRSSLCTGISLSSCAL